MHQMQQATPPPEELTPEEYEALKPLLQLADVGRSEKLAESLKPAQIRRQELKARFLTALREHGTISHAAAAAGVNRVTAWRWEQDDPDFAAEVRQWMHTDQVSELHESLYKIATANDPKMATASVKAGEFLLKALDRPTYGDHLKQETTLNINESVQVIHTVRAALSVRQVEKLQQLRTIDAESVLELSQSDKGEKL